MSNFSSIMTDSPPGPPPDAPALADPELSASSQQPSKKRSRQDDAARGDAPASAISHPRADRPPKPPATELSSGSAKSQGHAVGPARHHIERHFASQAELYKRAGQEIGSLLDLIDSKIKAWDLAGLPEVTQLGREIHTVVAQYADGKRSPLPIHTPAAESAVASRSTATHQSCASRPLTFAAAAKQAPAKVGSPPTASLRRIFIRLDTDHPARSASSHAILQKLRDKFGQQATNLIGEITHVKTGLAILPRTGLGEQLFASRLNDIRDAIQGCLAVEAEDKWAVFVLLNAPRDYTAYDGSKVVVTEKSAADEFKIQVPEVHPLKFRWSAKSPASEPCGTLVVALKEHEANHMPLRLQLFGERVIVKRKFANPRLERCPRCWDLHNPRTCTRTPRCRLCASTDHTEAHHPTESSPYKCTNCCGPYASDHERCPALPTVRNGQVLRPSRAEMTAIRKAGRSAYNRAAASSQGATQEDGVPDSQVPSVGTPSHAAISSDGEPPARL